VAGSGARFVKRLAGHDFEKASRRLPPLPPHPLPSPIAEECRRQRERDRPEQRRFADLERP
jgi:hypothetical protein